MNSRIFMKKLLLSPLKDTHPGAILIIQFYFLFVIAFRKFSVFDL